MRIVITGASGLVGSALVPSLRQTHTVIPMVRSQSATPNELQWTPGQRLNPDLLRDADAVIHLAGRNIGVRWTEQAKREILSSRADGTRTIALAISESFQQSGKPHTFISASAIGYYGSRGDEVLKESSSSGIGFLAETVRAWETAAQPAIDAGVRTVFTRLGVVLSPHGGALARMLPPFRLGLGGRIGSGRQWMSWVSLRDVVAAMEHVLRTPTLHGAVNLVGPNPLTNGDFTRALAHVLRRPAIFPVPAVAIRLALGEMGQELLLSSTRVEPQALLKSGYIFNHTDAESALQAQLSQ